MNNTQLPERLEWEIPAGRIEEVAYKTWMPVEKVKELIRKNETQDGVSILAILFALQFYKC